MRTPRRLALAAVLAVATPLLCLAQGEGEPRPAQPVTWMEIGGVIYGARPDERGPIGGGEGYYDIYTAGDLTATTADELKAALAEAREGQVIYVPQDAEIDLSGERTLSIPVGVTLAGNRGHEGSPGGLIKRMGSGVMLSTAGEGVRLTGLRFEGAYAGSGRVATSSAFFSIGHYGARVDNCEIYNFNQRGIGVGANAMGVKIHHNFLHHIWQAGLGYPVSTSASDLRVTHNKFDRGRHHIASSGAPGSGYEFAHNWVLPEATSHHVDMHGGRDRGDGTNIAGDWMHVHHNTFEGSVRPIAIRGITSQGTWVHNNWFHLPEPSGRVISPWPVGEHNRIQLYDNAYGEEDPQLLDVAFRTFGQAHQAGLAALGEESFQQARVWFEQALELAATGGQRASALLQVGHCHIGMEAHHAARLVYEQVLATQGAVERDQAAAREGLQRIQEAQAARPEPQWTLAFSDDFDRDEPGDDWQPLLGEWAVVDGTLRSGQAHAEILINREFPGLHRLELEIMTPADTARPCDFSPAIHSAMPEAPARLHSGGYWLQFGGAGNTLNRIVRAGVEMSRYSVEQFIQPGKLHHLVAEFDGEMVRLMVDGVTILEATDRDPLVGPERTRIGLVTYNVAHVHSARVYTAEP